MNLGAEMLNSAVQHLCAEFQHTGPSRYLYTFNRPNVTLVDCPKGVTGFTSIGVLANNKEHQIDCLIIGTGFESAVFFAFTDAQDESEQGSVKKRFQANEYEIYGVNGLALSDHWADGPRTLRSFQAHHFPNLFMMNGPQGALSLRLR